MPLNLFVNQLKTNLTLAKLFYSVYFLSAIRKNRHSNTFFFFCLVSLVVLLARVTHARTYTRKYYSRIRIWRMRMVDCRVHGTMYTQGAKMFAARQKMTL